MNFSSILYGGDYNPEQWPEETWSEDARLMQAAGVNLVSLGIFSWAKLEPQPGQYNFGWLDHLMDLLHAHGISVNLATPTASPPAWLVRMHPEILPVTAEGVTLWHGSRRHYCPHSPAYHEYATRIATLLAERYQDHPALAMWHVDNEYGCHFGECYCDVSAQAFRAWLQARYPGIQALNQAWGSAFWGQQYGEWAEIQPPRKSPTYANPTQQLDWARFCSDSWLACFEEQKNILQSITPQVPVTTNFMSFHKCIDYHKFAQHEDVVSNDSYPDISQPDWPAQAAMACDLIRSVGQRKPWVLMEQATSQVNWRQRNAIKHPGVMRLGSLQAVARGADGIMFFQWRQSLAGAEKHHSAMLPHAGPDTRIFREVQALGNELPKLTRVLGSQVQAEVAILFDWENWWALELDSHPSSDLKMLPQVYALYKAFFDRNITVDFVHPEDDLSQYQLLVAPNLYLVSDQAVKNINNYVENGGNLLLTFFSGIVDQNEHIRLGGYPAPFRQMLGIWVEEYSPAQAGQTDTVQACGDLRFTSTLWRDVIHLQGAQSLADYTSGDCNGLPALTRNRYGKGHGFYLGTELDADGTGWVIDVLCQQAGIVSTAANIPAGVEVVRRSKKDQSWLFILNHSGQAQQISLARPGHSLLTSQSTLSVRLEPDGVEIIEESK